MTDAAIPAAPPPGSLRGTFKPREVEELVDFWVNRPLAAGLVKILAPLPITPDQVTVLSGLVGLAGGVVVGAASLNFPWQVFVGGAIVYLSILLDCADGQLARLRGTSTMVGRALDGVVDVIPIAAVFLGFAALLLRSGYSFWLVNAVGWSAGVAYKWHVHGYDHAKNLYLHNVQPPDARKGALPTFEEIEEERQRYLARGDRLGAALLGVLAGVTRGQRTGWQVGRMGLDRPAMQTDAEREAYRDAFRFTMRLWSWNGVASHYLVFLVAFLVAPFHRDVVLWVEAFLLGPMSLYTFLLHRADRRIESDLAARLGRASG